MTDVMDVSDKLVLDPRAKVWCKLPYPGHPKGCPNFDKNPDCPPNAPDVSGFFNLDKPHYFIIESFDLNAHIERMRERHPDWSERQCRCVLYWQGTVRKNLKRKVGNFLNTHPGTTFTLIPEAMGVNVIKTANRAWRTSGNDL
jgi:predicted metal-binding protein